MIHDCQRHEIYILTRGRVNFLSAMIESLIKQKCTDFCIIVSDNREEATGIEEERTSIINKYPQVSYINRKNCNTLWLHIKECVDACKSGFITILHDDDFLEEDYVCWVQKKLIEYPSAGAVAPNSFIVNKDSEVIGSAVYGKRELSITSREELLLSYFSPLSNKHPSFPFYTYRTEIIKKSLKHALTVGYYSDIELLLRIIDSGAELIWGVDKKAFYRVHGENISSITHVEDRQRLLGYIKSVGSRNTFDAYCGWLIFELIAMIHSGASISKSFRLIRDLKLLSLKSVSVATFWFIKQINRKLRSKWAVVYKG